jgi:Protein of unknown function (DUF2934)
VTPGYEQTITSPQEQQTTMTQHIRDLAYTLWESQGRPHGRDIEHWAEAERLIRHQTVSGVLGTVSVLGLKDSSKADVDLKSGDKAKGKKRNSKQNTTAIKIPARKPAALGK